MANHINFNRHEIFNENDRRVVMDAINNASDKDHRELENSLFGLFDGYLYNDLLDESKAKLDGKIFEKLAILIDKIIVAVTPPKTENELYPNGIYYVGEYGATVASNDPDEIQEELENDTDDCNFYNEIPEGSVIKVEFVRETEVDDIFKVEVITTGNGKVPFDCRRITSESGTMFGTTHSIFGSENVKFIKK